MIYLDHSATTPLDPQVAAAMEPYWSDAFGNPASAHGIGARAAHGVARARREVALLLGCAEQEVYFTSGGTEGDGMSVWGVLQAAGGQGRVLYSALEHPAIKDAALRLAGEAAQEIPVDREGRLRLEALEQLLDEGEPPVLVCVMHASNEVGTVQPIVAAGALCRERGVPFQVDAVQTVAQLPFDVEAVGCDLATITAHKIHGPKGAGALYIREGTAIEPLLVGGGQERGMRPGTLNVPCIVGLGEACRQAREAVQGGEKVERMGRLRERLLGLLREGLPEVVILGSPTMRLPGHLSVALPGIDTAQLVVNLDAMGVAVSRGSACHAGSDEVPASLRAMELNLESARSTLRLTLGRHTTESQVEEAVRRVVEAVGLLTSR